MYRYSSTWSSLRIDQILLHPKSKIKKALDNRIDPEEREKIFSISVRSLVCRVPQNSAVPRQTDGGGCALSREDPVFARCVSCAPAFEAMEQVEGQWPERYDVVVCVGTDHQSEGRSFQLLCRTAIQLRLSKALEALCFDCVVTVTSATASAEDLDIDVDGEKVPFAKDAAHEPALRGTWRSISMWIGFTGRFAAPES
eukprot:scaffold7392_cov286-Pinguiococcus_pyrenoidosus.AAC.19